MAGSGLPRPMRLLAPLVLALTLLAGCTSPPTATSSNAPHPLPPATAATAVALAQTPGQDATAVAVTGVGAAVFYTGHQMGEPTIGVSKAGRIFAASDTADPQFGFRTDIIRSDDGGRNWTDVSPIVAGHKTHPATFDPMLWLDVDTNRVFDIDQIGLNCNYISSTDDDGATWTPPTPVCPLPVSDHQTLVTAHPTTIPATPVYPKIVYMCSNELVQTDCARSLDGGLTFQLATSPFTFANPTVTGDGGTLSCGALVGHLKADPDGTIYLPNACNHPAIAITHDSMTTWKLVAVSQDDTNGLDPTIAVGQNGTVYFTYETAAGLLKMAASKDQGATWSTPIPLLPPGVTAANLPASAAGKGDRVVTMYYGTQFPKGYAGLRTGTHDNATWDGYFTIVEGALGEHPTLLTVHINPMDDPLFRGACGPGRCPPGLYDFMDVQVDADGRPWGVLVDGCTDACATANGKAADSTAVDGLVVSLATGPSLNDGSPLVPIHGAKST
jgi:hypothetical protein